MMNLRHVMAVLSKIIDSADANSKMLKRPLKDEEPFIKSLNVHQSISVGQLRAAVKEYDQGEIRIGNTSYRIMAVPRGYEPSRICKLCCFSDKNGRSQRSCPRMSYQQFSRALCTFIGDGDHGYFEIAG